MAEDATYQGAAHRLQDGDVLEIGSTGALDVYGELDVKSGAALKLAGTDYAAELTRAAANLPTPETVANAVSSTAGTTGVQALAQAGISLLSTTGSTATSICIFRLPVPVANVRKTIIAYKGIDATHDAGVETNATAVTIGYGAANHRLAFDALDEAVELVGISATKWMIASNVGAVTASTNFTT